MGVLGLSQFEKRVQAVLDHEGGYSDRAADKGGPTNFGITWRTLAEAQRRGIVPASLNVKTMTETHARVIYLHMYWLEFKCNEMPAPIDLIMFDMVVNHSPKGAIGILQRGLRVKDDGAIGPQTIAAAKRASLLPYNIKRLLAERAIYYHSLCVADETQEANLPGWMVRVLTLHEEVINELP